MAHAVMQGKAQTFPSLALVEQAIPRLSRHQLASLCERLIDRMDTLDPDPDFEDAGDEQDTTGAEDDYRLPVRRDGPGCPIADAAEDDGEDCCEASDDRGGRSPNARFNGYDNWRELDSDPDAERWHQPAVID